MKNFIVSKTRKVQKHVSVGGKLSEETNKSVRPFSTKPDKLDFE